MASGASAFDQCAFDKTSRFLVISFTVDGVDEMEFASDLII